MSRVIVDICLLIGVLFALAGTVGIFRMPDVLTRMQASTCVATLGTIGVTVGAFLYAVFTGSSAGTLIKILVAGLVVILTNPVSNHALFVGAYKKGDLPETKLVCDDYKDQMADCSAEPENPAVSGKGKGASSRG